MINYHNKVVLTRHKADWSKLSFVEKVERIFGKHDKCEIVAAVTTVVSYFFSCRSIHQFLPSYK
jgi:flagellar biosynthesis protein FlhB